MVGEKILDAHGLGNGVLAYCNSLAASKVVLGDLRAGHLVMSTHKQGGDAAGHALYLPVDRIEDDLRAVVVAIY